MNFKLLLTFSVLTVFSSTILGQNTELPQNKNYRNAIKNKTRSADGKPGINYWTNFAEYDINVEVIPHEKIVKGSATILYYNNSPDTLNKLVLRLLQNVHKPTMPRNDNVDAAYLTDGITIEKLLINNAPNEWNKNNEDVRTLHNLNLAQPVLPKTTVTLYVEWHYKLNFTSNNVREGMIDSNSFFIAYWYPRLSVYDDADGWDLIQHSEQAEFYNDFGNYNVKIKVPGDYMVLATGQLQNASDVLNANVAARIEEALNNNDINLCVLKEDLRAKTVTVPNAFNTWHYLADTVTDFAFGISNHYLLDAASALIDTSSGKRVLILVAYDTSAVNYKQVCKWSQQSINYLNWQMPAVQFPYSNISVFQGNSFMEYPMLVNDMEEEDINDMQSTTLHEIAHSYFPFLTGINETRYAFMDEGWVTFFELLGNTACFNQKNGDKLWAAYYCKLQRGAINTPIMSYSYELVDNYGFNSYGKPALAYYTLMNFLGEEKFKTCLHEYIKRWQHRHPLPYDFFNTFNNVSKQDLNWFWQNWFFKFNYFDVGIDTVKATGNKYAIVLENTGGLAVPINLEITFTDGTTMMLAQKCDVWKTKKTVVIEKVFSKKIKQVKLDNGIYPDADKNNDIIKLN